jgi:uncharacterized membrane protein YciS (DUF1049 family)
MSKIKWIITVLVAFIIAALGAWIGSENNTVVQPVIFGQTLWELNLGTWLCLVFLLGCIVGFIANLLSFRTVKPMKKPTSAA